MRYVIYGAGAVGGVIGGRLHAAGFDVTLIARGAHLDALRSGGLHLITPEGDEHHFVPVAAGPEECDLDGAVVIMTMKSQDTVAALDALMVAAPPGVRVVCAQNGVANERAALRRFEHVYGMPVWLPAVFVTPGTVVQYSSPLAGSLDIGRYPQGDDAAAAAIAADFTAARFASTTRPRVMRAKYRKLLSNLGNALDAVCADRFQSGLYKRAQEEAEAVFDAAGIDVQPAEEAATSHVTIKDIEGQEWAGSSSRQSLLRSTGSVEADYLNGEIVLLGRLHGVATPVNALLQREANRAARARREPGQMTTAQLEAMIGP
jgi:2-dehydropantoate 2-reductase